MMCKKNGEEKEARRFVIIDTNNENGEDDKRTINMESDVIRLKGICRRRERAIRARTRLYTFV